MMTSQDLELLILAAKICVADQIAKSPRKRDPELRPYLTGMFEIIDRAEKELEDKKLEP